MLRPNFNVYLAKVFLFDERNLLLIGICQKKTTNTELKVKGNTVL